jgi:hypothetical protein
MGLGVAEPDPKLAFTDLLVTKHLHSAGAKLRDVLVVLVEEDNGLESPAVHAEREVHEGAMRPSNRAVGVPLDVEDANRRIWTALAHCEWDEGSRHALAVRDDAIS